MKKEYILIIAIIVIFTIGIILLGAINVVNEKNNKQLMLSVKQGDIDTVETLIEKGVDVNIQVPKSEATEWSPFSNKPNYYQEGNTALFIAVVKDIELTKILLENGADLNIKNELGRTSLHWASQYNRFSNKEIVELLIKYGADVNVIDNFGNTPLMLASLGKYPDSKIIKTLIDAGADVNATNDKGDTALLCASSFEIPYNTEVVDILINAGTDVNIKNKDGKDYAYYKKEYEKYYSKLEREIEDKRKSASIKEEPKIGMTAEEVEKSTWGVPDKINKTTTAYGVREQWVYETGRYVYLENGIVTAIQDYD